MTLYEALTGRLPFDGRNRVQVIFQHLNTPPVPPRRAGAGDPAAGVATCACGCWRRTPADRPQNYEELRQAFNTVMAASVRRKYQR